MSDITEESLLAAAQEMRKLGPLTRPPNYRFGMDLASGPDRSVMYGGMNIQIVDAQKQQRTERDVIGPWVRPRCPNRGGRKGTRRQWKRKNAPHHIMLYREPTDVLVYGRTIVATPHQAEALRRAAREHR